MKPLWLIALLVLVLEGLVYVYAFHSGGDLLVRFGMGH